MWLLSPVISGLTLVPLVAQSVLSKTVPWGMERNLGKSFNKVVSISQALGLSGGFLRPARASLGKKRSWRAGPKVEGLGLRLLHRANALQVRPSGQRRWKVRGHRAVTRLVSKFSPSTASLGLGRVPGGKCTGFRETGLP